MRGAIRVHHDLVFMKKQPIFLESVYCPHFNREKGDQWMSYFFSWKFGSSMLNRGGIPTHSVNGFWLAYKNCALLPGKPQPKQKKSPLFPLSPKLHGRPNADFFPLRISSNKKQDIDCSIWHQNFAILPNILKHWIIRIILFLFHRYDFLKIILFLLEKQLLMRGHHYSIG